MNGKQYRGSWTGTLRWEWLGRTKSNATRTRMAISSILVSRQERRSTSSVSWWATHTQILHSLSPLSDIFKVINPQIHVLDDGQLFPFVSSTTLHPEWPTAALDHVNRDVSEEVQEALLALRDHAASLKIGRNIRCDTTPELAELAHAAAESGIYTGYRTARR